MKNEQAIYRIKIGMALVAQYRELHFISLLLTLVFLVLMLLNSIHQQLLLWQSSLFFSIIFIGAVNHLLAIRIGFDQSLLKILIAGLSQDKKLISELLVILDNALSSSQLIPASKISRTLEERLWGCVKLFKKLLVLCCSQFFLVFIFIIISSL